MTSTTRLALGTKVKYTAASSYPTYDRFRGEDCIIVAYGSLYPYLIANGAGETIFVHDDELTVLP